MLTPKSPVRSLITPRLIQGTKLTALSTVLLVGVVGCASKPTPTYVSSTVYKDYSCAQLNQEYKRVNTAISADNNAGSILTSTGVNIGVHAGRGGIYPTVSLGLGSSKDTTNHKLSRLLGERDAVAQAAKFKGCDFPMPHIKK